MGKLIPPEKKQKIKCIESYNSNNNYYYCIKRLIKLQRRIRKYLKTKKKSIANIGNFTQVDTLIFMNDDNKQGDIDDNNEFNFFKFSTHLSCMKKKSTRLNQDNK